MYSNPNFIKYTHPVCHPFIFLSITCACTVYFESRVCRVHNIHNQLSVRVVRVRPDIERIGAGSVLAILPP